MQDPWPTPRHKVGSDEPSLRGLQGPCPERCVESSPPPAEEVTNHPPRLGSGGHGESSASSCRVSPQFGPMADPQSRTLVGAASDIVSEETIQQHIAGPGHTVALHESLKFFDDDVIKNQVHVAHFRGCGPHLFSTRTRLNPIAKSNRSTCLMKFLLSRLGIEAVITKARSRAVLEMGSRPSLSCRTAVGKKKNAALHKTSSQRSVLF